MDAIKHCTKYYQRETMEAMWGKFTVAYGKAWLVKYGNAIDPSTGKACRIMSGWYYALQDYSRDTLERAVDECIRTYSTRIPNLGEFLDICEKNCMLGIDKTKLCDYKDTHVTQCQNPGIHSPSVNGGGPMQCSFHHFGGTGLAPTATPLHSWLDDLNV